MYKKIKNTNHSHLSNDQPFLVFVKILWGLTLPLVLLLFFCSRPALAAPLTEEEALQKIYAHIEENYSHQKEDLVLDELNDSPSTQLYTFSLHVINSEPGCSDGYAGALHYDGTITMGFFPENLVWMSSFPKAFALLGIRPAALWPSIPTGRII